MGLLVGNLLFPLLVHPQSRAPCSSELRNGATHYVDKGECWGPKTMSQPSGSLLCGEGAGRHRNRPSCAGDTTIRADLWQVLRKYLLRELLETSSCGGWREWPTHLW